MAATLPSLTRTIDDAFTDTWFEIRPDAIDNILESNVVWAALKGAGCFTSQVGGQYITRTIRYGTGTRKAVIKGDTLTQGEPKLKTMARWDWKYVSAHVQRDRFDEQINNGPSKIADLINDRLGAAMDELKEGYEEDVLRAITHAVVDESLKTIASLCDMVPDYDERTLASLTYGKIARPATIADSGNLVYKAASTVSNYWWENCRKTLVTPKEVNLISDMRTLYNTVGNNTDYPNLIVTGQTLFELYEEFGLDKAQIIKDESSKLVDLGFEVLRFKGKPMVWGPNVYTQIGSGATSRNRMYFLNTKYIELVYDPNMWFDMGEWKPIPLQTTRIAHILCACNLICSQPRRQGLLTSETAAA